MRLRELLGLWRSLIIYSAPWRVRRLSRFYAPFVQPGDLVLELGRAGVEAVEDLHEIGAAGPVQALVG